MKDENIIAGLRKSIDLLIVIEFCKIKANRDQVREIMGSLDNNLFAKINNIFKKE